jgi:hypothetical protein
MCAAPYRAISREPAFSREREAQNALKSGLFVCILFIMLPGAEKERYISIISHCTFMRRID